MKFNQKMMMSLAVIAVIMSVMIMGTNGQMKANECCTSVSTANITSPITGFRIQKRNLPCVRAVIFYTDEGQFCMDRKLQWVKQKVMELLSKQNLNMTMNSTVSTPLSTTSSQTRNMKVS